MVIFWRGGLLSSQLHTTKPPKVCFVFAFESIPSMSISGLIC